MNSRCCRVMVAQLKFEPLVSHYNLPAIQCSPPPPPPYQSTVVLSHRKPASAMTSHDSCSAQVSDKRYTLWCSSDHELGFRIVPPEFCNCSCFNLDNRVCYTQESEDCMLSPKVWYSYMSVLCDRCCHLLDRMSRMSEDFIHWTVSVAYLNVGERAVL